MASNALSPFIEHIPDRPYCTDALGVGLQIRPKATALQRVYLQPNGPCMVWALVYDVDRRVVDPERLAPVWEDVGMPDPNFATINRASGRGHLVYMLTAGVCKTSAARLEPLRYAAAVQSAMCTALDADPGYAGLVTKNPLHGRWQTWEIHGQGFTLGELADYLDLSAANSRKYRVPDGERPHGLGRNCTLFDDGREWAYKAIRDCWAPDGLHRWSAVVQERLSAINGQFSAPLPFPEVKATAKSISKWTWTHITPDGLQELIQRTHTSELQAERGRKATNQAEIARLGGIASGQARRVSREQERTAARLMRAQGMTQQAIAGALGITQQAVSKWLHN
ncbi:MAG: replication initiation protein [Acidithiobacillus sp.]